MPFVIRLQSAIEQQIEWLGPADLVRIAAELLVVAILFLPPVGLFWAVGWWLKRSARLRPQLHIAGPVHAAPLGPAGQGVTKKVA